MSVPTFAGKFNGRVLQNEYPQTIAVEVLPTHFIDGKPAGYSRNLYVALYKEQTFKFSGLTRTEIETTTEITVTDTGGTEYTFSPTPKFTDGSSGTAIFEKESVTVERTRVSPHLWDLTVKRKGGALYCNGEKIINAPSWTGL